MFTSCGCLPYYVAVTGILLTIIYFLITNWLQSHRKKRRQEFPADTVILHQLGRGPFAPSVSCYPLKLETYLRMAKIPYQNNFTSEFSSKRKTPWITYNGKDVADSQFCIEYLKGVFGKDLNGHLTPDQKAVARAFLKLTEDSLYWALCAVTFGEDLSMLKSLLPYQGVKLWFISRVLQYKLCTQLWYQGMGRHSIADTISIGRADLSAISQYLGDKKFLMGDEPCETDCAVFGMVAQCKWHQPTSPYEKMITEEFKNLTAYCDRMKDRFWPDWDACTTAGGTTQGRV